MPWKNLLKQKKYPRYPPRLSLLWDGINITRDYKEVTVSEPGNITTNREYTTVIVSIARASNHATSTSTMNLTVGIDNVTYNETIKKRIYHDMMQSMMGSVLAVATGGGIGAMARYAISIGAGKLTPANFPLGTLTANLLGSFLIGVFWNYFDRVHISHEFRLFLFTGFLGGFTTFSTFARETVQYFKAGETAQAFFYLMLSNVLGLAMVALGFYVCHRFFRY